MLKLLNNKRGTETIEMVILLPVMLFVVFGSLSFLLATYSKLAVIDAAREGARAEALGISKAEDKVKEVLKDFNLKENLLEEPVTVSTEDENGMQYITVKVTYNQPSLVPGLPKLIGSNNWPDAFKLSGEAVFKKEKLDS